MNINRLNIMQTAKHLNISRATLFRYMARDKTFPTPYVLSPRKVYFDVKELDVWLNSKKHTTEQQQEARLEHNCLQDIVSAR